MLVHQRVDVNGREWLQIYERAHQKRTKWLYTIVITDSQQEKIVKLPFLYNHV
jgi:hypothetical protein